MKLFTGCGVPESALQEIFQIVPRSSRQKAFIDKSSRFVDKSLHMRESLTSIGSKIVLIRPSQFGRSTFLADLLHLHLDPIQFLGSSLDYSIDDEDTRRKWENLNGPASGLRKFTRNNISYIYERAPLEYRCRSPVFYFDFHQFAERPGEDLQRYILDQFNTFGKIYKVDATVNNLQPGCLNDLADSVVNRVGDMMAVFVDNFDTPVQDRDAKGFADRRAVMWAFGDAIKAQRLKLCFCIGSSPTADLLCHSSWAAFLDISHSSSLAESCGFTWNDITTMYAERFVAAQEKFGVTADGLKAELTDWYGNYTFTHIPCAPLFCPHSIIQFFQSLEFRVYRAPPHCSKPIAQIVTRFPEVLTETQIYKQTEDKNFLEMLHQFNPLNLTEALGLLRYQGFLSIQRFIFPMQYCLEVPNKTAKNMLATLLIDKALPGVRAKCCEFIANGDFSGTVKTLNDGLARVADSRNIEVLRKGLGNALHALSRIGEHVAVSIKQTQIHIEVAGKISLHIRVSIDKDKAMPQESFDVNARRRENTEFECKLQFSVEKLQITGCAFRPIRINGVDQQGKETDLRLGPQRTPKGKPS